MFIQFILYSSFPPLYPSYPVHTILILSFFIPFLSCSYYTHPFLLIFFSSCSYYTHSFFLHILLILFILYSSFPSLYPSHSVHTILILSSFISFSSCSYYTHPFLLISFSSCSYYTHPFLLLILRIMFIPYSSFPSSYPTHSVHTILILSSFISFSSCSYYTHPFLIHIILIQFILYLSFPSSYPSHPFLLNILLILFIQYSRNFLLHIFLIRCS